MGLISELRRRNVIKVAVAYGVVTWVLIQIAETTFPILKLPEWSVTFVTALLLIGFPLALIFAWAFELTPEGIKLEQHVDRSQSITHLTGRKLDYVIIAVLVVALGYFAFDKFVLDTSREAELVRTTTEAVNEQVAKTTTVDKSIAVLPFADMSPDGDQEYFSDGISEELLNVLSKIPDLRVTARTSSFQFKGENRNITDIGEQLNVGHILEGSVRKSGNQLRITAQLIKADDGFHLWSSSYDRELDDIFSVQDEISRAIVEALKEHLGLQVEAAPRVIAAASIQAHDAYLRGRHLLLQYKAAGSEGAIREFEKAIALDPDFALAYAQLAKATLSLAATGYFFGNLTTTEVIARAEPYAERALALDPTLAEAHDVMGGIWALRWKPEQALTHYRQAIQINPNYAPAYSAMGSIMEQYFGRYDEAFALTKTGLRLDPLSGARWNHVIDLIHRNRLDEADREIEKLAAVRPSMAALGRGSRMSVGGNWANFVLGRLDSLRIDPDLSRAWEYLRINFALIGLEKEALAISDAKWPIHLSMLGRHGEAVKTAEASLAEDPFDFRARRRLGMALAGAGEYERARPILEDMWQISGGRVTRDGLFHADTAAALIAIRRDAGEEAEVGELIAAIRDDVRRCRNADINVGGVDYKEGLADYLAGEHERGLALIAKAVEGGVFVKPWEAYLQGLYDDPGFAPIRAKQEARQVREREKFLDIVCTDNPYASFWQPVEGTCEQYSVAQAN